LIGAIVAPLAIIGLLVLAGVGIGVAVCISFVVTFTVTTTLDLKWLLRRRHLAGDPSNFPS